MNHTNNSVDSDSSSHNQHEEYHLVLFVANDEPNSRMAKSNLETIYENDICEQYQLKIVDVLVDFSLAAQYNVLVTPTLLIMKPESTVMVLGNLNDHDKVCLALGVVQDEPLDLTELSHE